MKSLNKIGFAILGTGMIAEYHAQAIAENAEFGAQLVAVGHYKKELFSEIGQRFGVPCLLEGEILANPAVDVVCICTPSGQHAEQAIRAAEAGKHVFVEKPMATRVEDAEAMIAACQKQQVQLGVVFPSRTKPLYQDVFQAVHSGQLGEITLGLVNLPFYRPQSYYDQAAWRGTWALDGGGVLMNQGIHQIDLLTWFMGDPVEFRAFAQTLQRKIEVEDTLSACLRFGNGAMAAINATTTASPGFPPRIEIYGTRGGIQLEGDTPVRWVIDGKERFPGTDEPGDKKLASAGAGADPRNITAAGHTALIRDFIESLREGRPPMIDGKEGKRSVEVILGIYEAAGLLNTAEGSPSSF